MTYNSQAQAEVRNSLRRIVRTILGTPTFWPQTELADRLKQDLEKLVGRIDSMEMTLANNYCCALSLLARQMPSGIGKVYRGDLAELLSPGLRPQVGKSERGPARR